MSSDPTSHPEPLAAFAAVITAAAPENGRGPATVATRLRLGSGLAAAERPDILARLASLDLALAPFAAAALELELSMTDRDRPGQATTLQCWIAGRPRLAATSSRPAFVSALEDVRDDLRRQLDDAGARSLTDPTDRAAER